MIHNTFNDFIKSQKKYSEKDEALRIIYEATGLSGTQDIIEDFESKEYPRDSEVLIVRNTYPIDIESWENFMARVDNDDNLHFILLDEQYPLNCKIYKDRSINEEFYAYITIVMAFGDINKRFPLV